MCCSSCPISMHFECMDESDWLADETELPDEWFCPDCVQGKRPVFGDIVWVKYGTYRWWPAQIRHEEELPSSVRNAKHNSDDFAVRFYGTGDYGWIGYGNTMPWSAREEKVAQSGKSSQTPFARSVNEAVAAQVERNRELTSMLSTTTLKPPHYRKLRVNSSYVVYCVCVSDSLSECPEGGFFLVFKMVGLMDERILTRTKRLCVPVKWKVATRTILTMVRINSY